MLGDDVFGGFGLRGGALEHHLPGVDDRDLVCKRQRQLDVLLDQPNGLALAFQL